MVGAIVLLKAEVGKDASAAKALGKVKGVLLAFPTIGRADVVLRVEAPSMKQLLDLVLKIGSTEGVTVTETLVGGEM
jgi:uncharacterized protein with GYD domain